MASEVDDYVLYKVDFIIVMGHIILVSKTLIHQTFLLNYIISSQTSRASTTQILCRLKLVSDMKHSFHHGLHRIRQLFIKV